MKKFLLLFLTVVIVVGSLSGCSFAKTAGSRSNDTIQIVTTIFPEYDWVENILGENPAHAKVTMLLDNGVDLHSYQPTADDILTISTCDLFVYVGGESDAWVEEVLQNAANEHMVVINLLDTLGDKVKEEELVEGMEAEDEEAEEEEEEPEYDEHVWLSLRNASVLCDSIAEAIASIDADNAEEYRNNAAAYKEKLSALDAEYQEAVSEASVTTLLFGDRFPFRYMVDDYDLDYYAAFVGCSAETEASFETITFLAEKVDELSLPSVMVIEGTDHRIAETIIENTRTKDQQILTLDSMQGTASGDIQNGATYLSIMENNLVVLKEALK
ncbi:MAG: zinc ABC transporter substrate-binding protein [Lachnospiraceae bacterium]|nr:zinc ABC transporter substrate-binding protein [Lachnospiraceae bacterium]